MLDIHYIGEKDPDYVTIETYVHTGFVNGKHKDRFQVLKVEWESLNAEEKEEFLEDCATNYRNESIEYGAFVVE